MDISSPHAFILHLDRNWHIAAHRHVGMHEMIVVLDGRIHTEIAGRSLDGGAGSVLLYPADTVHEEWARGGRPLTTVCIGWSGDRPQGEILGSDARGRMTEVARWLADLSAEPGPASRRIAEGLMAALLHEFSRPTHHAGEDLVACIRAWALPRLAEPITLDDLASAAGLSRFHFVRAFRSAAGTTPMRWLRHQRLQAARTLLLATDQPLRSIAAQVGFADEFQLSRVFRRDAGKSPSQLRQR